MRGRIPEPTRLKILNGVRSDRINHDEPVFPPGSTKAPDWLGSYARSLWDGLAPILSSAGLLTSGDIPAFEMLCDEYDRVRRDPLDVKARDRYRRLLVEFGLTPASRSRVTTASGRPKDKFAEFLDKQGQKRRR